MHKLIIFAAVAVFGATNGGSAGSAGRAPTMAGMDVPKSWAPADSADSLWRQGRNAISDENWKLAEKLFSRIHEDYPKSAYAADSYYWEAFALSRRGGTDNIKDAVTLLTRQQERFASASSVKNGDSKSLLTRLQGTLARNGDATAAAAITERAGGRASRRSGGDTPPGCKSEDDDDRVEALNALLQMGSDDALPILKKVLARRDACSEVLRRKAVFLVSQKRGDDAADILMETAKSDPDKETREQAVFWLSQVNSDKAVPLLEEILKTTTDEAMQDKAIFALSQKSGDNAQQALRDYAGREDASEHLREQAIFWLGQRHSDNNAKFLRDLFAKTSNSAMKDKIIFSISQTRNDGNDQWLLDQAVNTKNSMELRKQALFWAGQTGSVDMAKLGALYDKAPEEEFKKQVIFVLSQRGKSPEAVDKLIDIAKNETNKSLRKEAIFWLGQSHDPRALKALQDLINR
ncbi:MAG: HEAT repeat domain-containing protein [Gemmatimonadales bacterium]